MKIQLNEKQRMWAVYLIVAAVTLAVSLFFGVQYPMPLQPDANAGEQDGLVALGTMYIDNLQVAGYELIDGAADAIQLRVQGYTTQTNSLLVLETSAGTDKFTVSNDGNTVIVGTTDQQGNVSDSGGAWTLADNALIDGAADAIQLTVQGNATQTSSLLVAEQSDGTDVFRVSNDGNTLILGTTDQYGDVYDSGGTWTVLDDASISGAFGVTGASTLGGLVTINDNAIITGTLNVQTSSSNSTGAWTVADNALIDGAADAIQLTVQGYTTQTTSLLVLETSAGTDVLTVSAAGNTVIAGTTDQQGNVSDSSGTWTVADDASVTGALGIDGVVTANSDLIVDDVFNIDDTAYTLSGTQTLTPTASYYAINAGGILTLTLGTSGVAAGDILIISNASANNVNIPHTNMFSSTGAALDLGQYDVAAFLFDGTRWLELWLIANS